MLCVTNWCSNKKCCRAKILFIHYNWSTYYFADSYALHNLRYSCELQVISNGVINNKIIIIIKHYLYFYIFIQVHIFVNTVKASPKLARSIMIFNYLKVDNFCTCTSPAFLYVYVNAASYYFFVFSRIVVGTSKAAKRLTKCKIKNVWKIHYSKTKIDSMQISPTFYSHLFCIIHVQCFLCFLYFWRKYFRVISEVK